MKKVPTHVALHRPFAQVRQGHTGLLELHTSNVHEHGFMLASRRHALF